MNGALEPLRRRFLLRGAAVIAGMLAGAGGVAWLSTVGRHGLILAVFSAVLMLVLCTRALSEMWSNAGLELLEKFRTPLVAPECATRLSKDLEESFDHLRDYVTATVQHARHMNDQRKQLLAEVFHALAQPLTTLRCSLELTARSPRTADEYRTRVGEALDQAERAARVTAQLRHLAEAIEYEHQGESCRFDESLNLATEEIAALGEIRHVKVRMVPGPAVTVSGDGQRVAEALFHMLEFSLDCAPRETELVARGEMGDEALIFEVESRVTNKVDPSDRDENHTRREADLGANATLGIRVADHILQTVGGKLERELRSDTQVLRATLPLAQASAEQEMAASLAATVS